MWNFRLDFPSQLTDIGVLLLFSLPPTLAGVSLVILQMDVYKQNYETKCLYHPTLPKDMNPENKHKSL